MRLRSLLRRNDVAEESELRSSFGICAYHGGGLEKVTDVIAKEAAAACGASYYGLALPDDPDVHIASADVDPSDSAALDGFFAHVKTVMTIHGFGRHDQLRTVMLGGRNRALAMSLGDRLRTNLGDEFEVVDDLESIPTELRGIHPDNPVNLPANAGVQVELPPGARWNREEWGWSDHAGVSRAAQVDQVIAAIVETVEDYTDRPDAAVRAPVVR